VAPRLTIVVPFHKGLPLLERALSALVPLRPGDELLVAADGAVDDCQAVAAAHGARVIEIEGPRGPAVARNVAAASARGDVLVFVDADVVASTEAVERVARIFASDPELGALFGAYDEDPGAPGFVSQYKNLAHSFIHQQSAGAAQTFWAGFGAVRRDAYQAVGGFDERFERPSIEDIDLGYRLTAAGYRIRLDPSLAVCHLKRWTLRSMITSDVFDRGIPWTQLILRYSQFGSGLNMKHSYRASVVFAYLAAASLVLGAVDARFLWGVPLGLAAVAYLSRDYYRFFLEKRGVLFALGVFPLHVLYHLYNGLSFAIGTVLFVAARHFGVRLSGALPAYAPSSPASPPSFRSGGDLPKSSRIAATPDA
jgi:glycosyltransferase involved in cell wall biosynthesis